MIRRIWFVLIFVSPREAPNTYEAEKAPLGLMHKNLRGRPYCIGVLGNSTIRQIERSRVWEGWRPFTDESAVFGHDETL
jgi:hypothetical protein